MLMLHFYEITDGSEIIAKVQIPGTPDATHYCFHWAKLRKIAGRLLVSFVLKEFNYQVFVLQPF